MKENDAMTQATPETNDAMRQPTSALPSTARVVVIGGGAVGCSVLYLSLIHI